MIAGVLVYGAVHHHLSANEMATLSLCVIGSVWPSMSIVTALTTWQRKIGASSLIPAPAIGSSAGTYPLA